MKSKLYLAAWGNKILKRFKDYVRGVLEFIQQLLDDMFEDDNWID